MYRAPDGATEHAAPPPSLWDVLRSHAMKHHRSALLATLVAGALACAPRWASALEMIQCGEALVRTLDDSRYEAVVSVSAGEVLSIAVTPDHRVPSFVPRWRLLGVDRKPLHLSDGDRRCIGRCETESLDAGLYVLVVSEPGRDRGDFVVSVEAVSATANGLSNGPPTPICARIVDGAADGTQPFTEPVVSGSVQRPGEADTFTFEGAATAVLQITVDPEKSSPTFDPRWRLFDPQGMPVKTSDGSLTCLGTCETAELPAPGVYTVLVADGRDDDVGRYALAMKVVRPGIPGPTATVATTSTSLPATSTVTSVTSTTETTAGEVSTTTTTLLLYELADTIQPPPAAVAAPQALGTALAASDGRLYVGAPYDDTAVPDGGAVLVIDVAADPTVPGYGRLERTLTKPGTPASSDQFGAAVAAGPGWVVAGAPGDGGGGTAFVFAGAGDLAPRPLAVPGLPPGARFGAALAAAPGTVVVGAPGFVRDGVPAAGRAFVFDAATGTLLHVLERPGGAVADDRFGAAVAIAGGRVLVGAPATDDRPGHAFLFELATGAVLALAPAARVAADEFGAAVAFAGDDAIVGAPGARGGAGAASRFAPDGVLLDTLDRGGGLPGDRYGAALAFAGETLFVGAPGDAAQAAAAGAVYPWDLGAEPPVLEDDLVVRKPRADAGDLLGAALASDGERLFAGAPGDDSGAADGGAALVFRGVALEAVFRQRLDSDAFGAATTAFDGELAVGSPESRAGAGSVSLLDRETGSSSRTFINPGAEGARFGYAVAALGEEIVVGAPFQDGPAGSRVGAVYVFAPDGSVRLSLQPPTPVPGDQFGFAVATAGEGILVGAPATGVRDSGVVHLFDGATGRRRVTFRKPIPATGDFFGAAVAGEGTQVLVGAPFDGEGGGAYLFQRDSAVLDAVLRSPMIDADDLFGAAGALAERWVVIGAPLADLGAPESGCVHVFDRAAGTLVATLGNPTPDAGDHFGAAVAALGDRVLVGAPADDAGAPDTGAVHLFDVATGALLQTLRNPPQTAWDRFGFSVALTPAGPLVGSPGPSRVYLFAEADTAPAPAPRAASRIARATPVAAAMEPKAAPRCGNGLVDPGEACDDGNDADTDDCRTDCTRGPCCVIDPRAQARCDDDNPCTDDVVDQSTGCTHVPNGRCCRSDGDCGSGQCRVCVGCFLYAWDCCDRGSECLEASGTCDGTTCLEAAYCRCEGKLDCAGEPLPGELESLFGEACDQLRLEVSIVPNGTPVGKAALTAARGRTRSARQMLRKAARTARRLAAADRMSRTCRRTVLEQVRTVRRAIPLGKRLRRCVLSPP